MEERTHIESVRLHLDGDADLDRRRRVRLRVASRLEGVDWHPPQLPPSAVLLVRRLEDPSPGGLCIDSSSPVPDPKWEQALKEMLGEIVAKAERPRSGRIRSEAEAVLFRDEAEAWACWAHSVAGSAPDVWWTRSLRRTRPDAPGRADEVADLAGVFELAPRTVPAVVRYWTDWGIAESTVVRMPPDSASQLLKTVCQAYEVAPPEAASGSSIRAGAGSPGSGGPAGGRPPGPEAGGRPNEGTGPPWTDLPGIASEDRALAPVYRQWIGIMRALARTPGRVAAPAFRARWKAWIDRTGAPLPGERPAARHGRTTPGSSPDGDGSPTAEGRPHGDGAHEWSAPVARDGRRDRERPDGAGRGGFEDRSAAERIERAGPEEAVTADGGAAGEPTDRRPEGTEHAGAQSRGPDRGSPPRARTGEDRRGGAYTATELGGVWYLVNAIEETIGEGILARPDPDGQVRPWAALEVLARALLREPGTDGRSIPHSEDALWRLLARLDGRDPGESATEALPALAGWAEEAVSPFGARVIGALDSGAPEPGGSETDAVGSGREDGRDEESARLAALLEVPARVYHTRTHVDVLIPREEVRLDVRRAGLDRDPGWRPAYGRVIQLHFRVPQD